MSPTSPTYATLHRQLNKAHHRIRELEARETDLLAQMTALSAVVTELTREVHAPTVDELSSSSQQPASCR
jgi:hypothetical protein